MPNHVGNIVHMKGIGTRKELFIEDDEGNVNLDFEKIIPMPQELLDSQSPMSDFEIDLAMKALFIRLSMMPRYQYNGEYRKFLDALSTVSIGDVPKWAEGQEVECCIRGLQYINNLIRYGYPSWYEWCTNMWGTKWNSYWGSILNDDLIKFITAWDIPQSIYIALSNMYPYDEITVDWFNEGGIFGQTRYLDGEQIEEKVYKFTDDYYEEYDKKLFHKVELIEHNGKF